MIKNLPAFLCSILFCASTFAQPTPATATPFEQVFSVVSSPQIFVASVDKFLLQLNGLCKQSTRSNREQIKLGNIECVNDVGVDSFSVSTSGDGHVGFIQVSFFGIDKVNFIEKRLSENFGKASKMKYENQQKWTLKPSKKGGVQRYVNLEISKEDGIVYFQIGENQGP
jgi:hypothetical protein